MALSSTIKICEALEADRTGRVAVSPARGNSGAGSSAGGSNAGVWMSAS
jgi:hypothetical protein